MNGNLPDTHMLLSDHFTVHDESMRGSIVWGEATNVGVPWDADFRRFLIDLATPANKAIFKTLTDHDSLIGHTFKP